MKSIKNLNKLIQSELEDLERRAADHERIIAQKGLKNARYRLFQRRRKISNDHDK